MGNRRSFMRRLRGVYDEEIMKRPGWRFEATGGGHVKATYANGEVVYFGGSPSDSRRAGKNILAIMRRVERLHTV